MKKRGSTSDFTETRDKELYGNFLTILRESRGVALRDMFAMAAQQPASRFWVSETRAADMISLLLRGVKNKQTEKMNPTKRRMYGEILRRVRERMAADPELCMTHAVDAVVCEPAPEFYLTDESARIIIYRHRRRRKASRGAE